MKAVLICFLIPALCMAQTCMFLNGSITSPACSVPDGTGCSMCGSGYGMYDTICYPLALLVGLNSCQGTALTQLSFKIIKILLSAQQTKQWR